jgi:hypothetical protein
MPKQMRAWGRPKKDWMEGIGKAISERNLNEGQWEDRKQWSLGVRQHRKAFRNWYIYIGYDPVLEKEYRQVNTAFKSSMDLVDGTAFNREWKQSVKLQGVNLTALFNRIMNNTLNL